MFIQTEGGQVDTKALELLMTEHLLAQLEQSVNREDDDESLDSDDSSSLDGDESKDVLILPTTTAELPSSVNEPPSSKGPSLTKDQSSYYTGSSSVKDPPSSKGPSSVKAQSSFTGPSSVNDPSSSKVPLSSPKGPSLTTSLKSIEDPQSSQGSVSDDSQDMSNLQAINDSEVTSTSSQPPAIPNAQTKTKSKSKSIKINIQKQQLEVLLGKGESQGFR